jgi:hypothetical protein
VSPTIIETPDELEGLPIWDAWFDPRELRHQTAERIVVFSFAVGPSDSELAARSTLTRLGRLGREYQTAFEGWTVTIRHVEDVRAADGWADMGVLTGVGYEPATREIVLESNDACRIRVERLRVEAIDTGPRYMRRRVDVLGLTTYRWP